jgi:para-aminobenzoate synthetase/4-amino-4-deoxychorismate lyase
MTLSAGARFDDLSRGRAMVCPRPHQVLVAERPQDVPPLLAEVEAATAGGDWAFGYVGYEAAPGLDPALRVAPRSADCPPTAWFGICATPAVTPPLAGIANAGTPAQWRPDWTDCEHAAAVGRARDHIAAGDIYQVNLTDRLRTSAVGDPRALYARLATAQQGAYNAYLDLGRFVIASASPELFFEWADDRIRTRPMKGTIGRGDTAEQDAANARHLRGSAKEQAENLMIVDLLRNDLSRIARCGTVDVTSLFSLERYPTVWQLTSEITAQVRPGCGLTDIFRALFPCGSVTGAPKARSMQIIRDVESGPRGIYCGAIGLVGPPGAEFRARFNVAIRTAVVDRERARAVYGAGGGITWDSDPVAERAELLGKAAILGQTSAALTASHP